MSHTYLFGILSFVVIARSCEVPTRLVGGTIESEGRVEVFYQGQWGTVCNDRWDLEDGAVVCHQLGHVGVERVVDARDEFGSGSGEIWLGEVACLGTEQCLSNCSHSGWGNVSCAHSEDVAVVCTPSVPSCEVPIRLIGGNVPSEGRIEVFYQGQWGTVCNDEWDIQDAAVVCRQLGYVGAERVLHARNEFGTGSGEIWLDEVDCRSTEQCLSECDHPGWGDENCFHFEDAAVVCSPPPVTEEPQSESESESVSKKPTATSSSDSGGLPEFAKYILIGLGVVVGLIFLVLCIACMCSQVMGCGLSGLFGCEDSSSSGGGGGCSDSCKLGGCGDCGDCGKWDCNCDGCGDCDVGSCDCGGCGDCAF